MPSPTGRLRLRRPIPGAAISPPCGATSGSCSAARGFTLFDDGSGNAVQHGVVGDSVGPARGFVWVPAAALFTPGRTVAFSILSPHDAAVGLSGKLQVDVDPDGNFMSIQLRGADQQEVAEIVNAVAERFVAGAGGLERPKV